jgi:Co/Zn/Cd efflux system component
MQQTEPSYVEVIQKTLQSIPGHLRNFFHDALITTKRIWREHPPLRALMVYAAILSTFAVFECVVAFMLSHSLVVLFCAFYTVHRALHYLILILANVLDKPNLTPNSLFTPYSYGYRRLEVILRFSNGVFAAFISFAFCTEGIQRLVEGHHIHL